MADQKISELNALTYAASGDELAIVDTSEAETKRITFGEMTGSFAVSGGEYHDGFSDYVANEHIDWTTDQGATNIDAGNYTNTDTTAHASFSQLDYASAAHTGFEPAKGEDDNFVTDVEKANIGSLDTAAYEPVATFAGSASLQVVSGAGLVVSGALVTDISNLITVSGATVTNKDNLTTVSGAGVTVSGALVTDIANLTTVSGAYVATSGALVTDISNLVTVSGALVTDIGNLVTISGATVTNKDNLTTVSGAGVAVSGAYVATSGATYAGSLSLQVVSGALLTIEGTSILSTGEGAATKYLKVDGDGTCSWQVVEGGGDVSKVGTPLDNQIGIWTGDGTIEGDSGLSFDGTDLNCTGEVIGTNITTISGATVTNKDNLAAVSGAYVVTSGALVTDIANLVTVSGAGLTTTNNLTTVSGAGVAVSGALVTDIANLTAVSGALVTDIGNLTAVSGALVTDIGNLVTVSGATVTNKNNLTTVSGAGVVVSGTVVSEQAKLVTVSGATVTNKSDITTVSGAGVAVSGALVTDKANLVTVSGAGVAVSGALVTDKANLVTVSGAGVVVSGATATHIADNTQAHSDYLLNSAGDSGVGLYLTQDNSTADQAYSPMVLYNTDDTPPAASGFPVGTLYVQYTA